MDLTPIKVLHPKQCCFICKKGNLDPKDKTKIYGKSKMDLPVLIIRATQIDLNNYEDRSELAICCLCYRLLQRYKNALEKLDSIVCEIKKSFSMSTNVSVKRMNKSMQYENPAAKKILTFRDDDLDTQTPRPVIKNAASSNGQSVPTTVHPLRLSQECTLPPIPLEPQSASTPEPARGPQSGNGDPSDSKSKNVRIIVQYPSRTFEKELVGNYAVLGKAVVHGVPQRLARAVFREENLRTCIFKEMQRYLKSEMKCVCSRKNPSLLRVKTKE